MNPSEYKLNIIISSNYNSCLNWVKEMEENSWIGSIYRSHSNSFYDDKNEQRYSYISDGRYLRGLKNVNIILIYGWDYLNREEKINTIFSLLISGSKVIGDIRYIDSKLWTQFKNIEMKNLNLKIKEIEENEKFNRFQIMKI